MQAASAAQLFQSDEAIANSAARTAKAERTGSGISYGSPICSTDKLLAAALCPYTHFLWTGTSSGALLCFDLDQGAVVHRIQAHGAPVSALAYCRVAEQSLVFTGSWDRAVHIYAVSKSGATQISAVADAASDFIKAICISAKHRVAITGGSDRTVRVWDLSLLFDWINQGRVGEAPVPTLAAVARHHTRPVTSIAIIPDAPGIIRSDAGISGLDIFSADSMGRVVHSRMENGRIDAVRELDGNETAVNDMIVAWRAVDPSDTLVDQGVDEEWAPDVWTASVDKHARRFPLSPSAREGTVRGRSSAAGAPVGGERPILADRALEHPLGVGAVAVVGDSVVTTCDGDLWMWCGTKPTCAEGHSHEAGYLGVWMHEGEPWIVSAGLDGSVRRWPLHVLHGAQSAAVESIGQDAGPMLTAEEEAELAELM